MTLIKLGWRSVVNEQPARQTARGLGRLQFSFLRPAGNHDVEEGPTVIQRLHCTATLALFVLLSLAAIVVTLACSSSGDVSRDRAVLVEFYHATKGPQLAHRIFDLNRAEAN